MNSAKPNPSHSPQQPTSTAQPSAPTPEQQLSQLRSQHEALSQLLWQVIRAASPEEHTITVLPGASDPLWEIWCNRSEVDGKPDPTGAIRVCAATIPELTEHEKKKVVRYLRGTDRPLGEALHALKLRHPMAYVEQKIADRIKFNATDRRWESVTAPTLGERIKNVLRFPKA